MKRFLTACLFLVALTVSAFAQNAPVGYGAPSAALESSHVLKSAGGSLYDFQVNTGGTAVWVMVFDLSSAPSNGTVTPVKWYQVAINSTLSVNFDAGPILFQNGITMVCSSTGPFTLTLTSTCVFSGEVK